MAVTVQVTFTAHAENQIYEHNAFSVAKVREAVRSHATQTLPSFGLSGSVTVTVM